MGVLVSARLVAELVHDERVDELVDDAHAGIQRGGRVLEDHGHHATDLHALLGGAVGHVLALEQHLAGGGLLQAAHHVGRSGLAAAGLTNDADGLARHQAQIHLVDRLDLVWMQN